MAKAWGIRYSNHVISDPPKPVSIDVRRDKFHPIVAIKSGMWEIHIQSTIVRGRTWHQTPVRYACSAARPLDVMDAVIHDYQPY